MKNRGVQRRVARLGDAQNATSRVRVRRFSLGACAPRTARNPDGTAARLERQAVRHCSSISSSAPASSSTATSCCAASGRSASSRTTTSTKPSRRCAASSAKQHVVTVAGRGYQFVTPVRRVLLSAPPTPSRARAIDHARESPPSAAPAPTHRLVAGGYTEMALAMADIRGRRRCRHSRDRAARADTAAIPRSETSSERAVSVQPLAGLSR